MIFRLYQPSVLIINHQYFSPLIFKVMSKHEQLVLELAELHQKNIIVDIIALQETWDINPILHTWFRDSCFICDGSSTIQVFPLLFKTGMVI